MKFSNSSKFFSYSEENNHQNNGDIYNENEDNTLNGSNENDCLKGDKNNNLLNGRKGNDTLIGGKGHDTLNGGSGYDRLKGNSGNDVLNGGKGNDTLIGDGDKNTADNHSNTSNGFSANFELSSLDGTNGFIISGIDAVDFSGDSVSSAGDVNGDGVDDIIIGAAGADINGNSNVGESYVVFGNSYGFDRSLNLNFLDGTNGFVINGIDELDNSGDSVSSAGDVNGDGIDDIIIGADGADPNGNSGAGESYVVFGNSYGFERSLNLNSLDGTNGFVINGIDAGDRSGNSVSSAGDVNGDSIDDIIIGAFGADSNGNLGVGESYVVFGNSNGFNRSLDLSSLDGTNGFTINGIDAIDFSGLSVSVAGDVNGDGIDDIIIGAPNADPNGNDRAGESYVVFGNSNGFGRSLDLSSLDGTNGFTINGIDAGGRSGDSVSSAGDVNGDGIDDLIIGGFAANPNDNSQRGIKNYVVFGNSNGFDPILNLNSLDGNNGFTINNLYYASFDDLSSLVSSAGDINNDGIDDIVFGANGQLLDGSLLAGGSYVIFGNEDGFDANFDLSSLDGNNGFTFNAIDPLDGLGHSVSNAGDVNSDGIDDIIVAAYRADPNGNDRAGESYVVFGKNSNRDLWVNDNNRTHSRAGDDTLNGGKGNDLLKGNGGNDVLKGGEGNDVLKGGEGNDVLIGDGGKYTSSKYNNNSSGFGANFELSSLDGTNGFTINGIDAGDLLGLSLSSAGDVNGDGIDDLVLGADRADPNGINRAGESYVVFGNSNGFERSLNLSSLDGNNGFTINGIDAIDSSGRSVSSAGDINGDGIDDLIIGAPYADPNNKDRAGESYVIFGNSNGFERSLDLSSLDGNNGFTINGINPADFSGVSVSSAGDVNGDSIDDIIIGASNATSNGNEGAGESYVVFGDSNGFERSLDLSSLDGNNGFTINGIDTFERSGFFVSSAGDVNGDGIDDIIVSAPTADPNGNEDAGESYVVFGNSNGFERNLNLNSLDGTNGFTINGIDAGDLSGNSVSSAGDVNGDGIDDIIIGALIVASDASQVEIESYVVFGNSNGFERSLDLNSLDGTNGFVLNGIDATQFSENLDLTVSSAGDVNDDGIDDIIIGAFIGNPDDNAGKGYVVYGDSNGFDPILDLSTLDGNNGFTINGINQGDFAGSSVSAAGDVNGDGIDDIIVGAPNANPGNNERAGESYVVFGKSSNQDLWVNDNDSTQYSVSADDTLYGGEGDDLLKGGQGDDVLKGDKGNDRLKGNGGNDVLKGGMGDDTLVGGRGSDILKGGTGQDVFKFNASDFALDTKDIIKDFEVGADRLVIKGLNTNDVVTFDPASNNILVNAQKVIKFASLSGSDFMSVEHKDNGNFEIM